MRPKERIMYIECRSDNYTGPASIGLVKYSKTGKSVHYKGKTFETLDGSSHNANYFDIDTGDPYWISGCCKDGRDAKFTMKVNIDADIREGYWTEIRKLPQKKTQASFIATGKITNRMS